MPPNVPAFPIAFYGALAVGAVVADESKFKSREIGYYLRLRSQGDTGLAHRGLRGNKGATDAGAQVRWPRLPTWLGFSPGTLRR
jgi:hypothetical protein